jgi:microcin C transport system substrate-binding protein
MRRLIGPATIAIVLLAAPAMAAEDGDWHHGLSLFGELKYPPGFTHFDYVNPDAPKGGALRRPASGTFDTLNPFNIKGTPAAGSTLIYDTLMTGALDEPSSEYGLLAEAVSYPPDYASVTYTLRAEARWHDGEPVTADDVIWSLGALKSAHPQYRFYYKNVVSAEKAGPRQVTFRFDQTGNRELPQITGQMPVLPKHYWEGTGGKGARDLASTTLEPPLGSGPYRFGEVKTGRSIAYERVKDYWGAELPVNVGQNNFDLIRFEYFRDTTVLLEAFKADAFDLTIENSAKRWATGYNFPAREKGDVIVQAFQTRNAEPMQAFAFNTRRSKFADARVRQAFNLAFDFEWLNENVFYNQYHRTDSYFENSELEATGVPEGLELQILEEVRDRVPPEVFEKDYENPIGGTTQKVRANLREAQRLLGEAGWEVRDRVLTNTRTGEKMVVEFLIVQPDMERLINPFRQNLERIGIRSQVRAVDASQYETRTETFDFDIIIDSFGQSLSPGNEQRDYWGSEAADRDGSRNTIGIRDEAIDYLIDRIIYARDRAELVAATRALDRVLLWNHFVVPQYYSPDIRTARWNRFGLADVIPDYGFSTSPWWYDDDKAARISNPK